MIDDVESRDVIDTRRVYSASLFSYKLDGYKARAHVIVGVQQVACGFHVVNLGSHRQ